MNLTVPEGSIATSRVQDVELVFDKVRLGEILEILSIGLVEYVWSLDQDCVLTSKYTQGRVSDVPRKILKGEMPLFMKLLFEVVHKGVLPNGEYWHKVTVSDMGLANTTNLEELVDQSSFIIRHMARFIDPTLGPHQLALRNLLTRAFKACKVLLCENRHLKKKDMIDMTTAL